ncbi:TetR/AcrR family transcriptional regulator [Plectonema cf. radiosum LEGE 06105]|uniref:TetR/AcrR family transcriptional regulator n=1 Tax=Plectonema cf. radiosum LEGE 06105 TaxID=945769 RepID=A0A8J7F7A6_9CYAN|nr:TetR/AcrR family transcriptional regulator [Plectonema radiosum]MBE9216077.1 TetR/AcrR family transcriptional regulator [Plectonema cf. radiosum LEGE 06105]
MGLSKPSETYIEKPKDKVEQILQGAMQEFLVHGYAGTSMDRIAASGGVSKATVYSYFSDKQGLFKALIERLAKERFQSVFGTQKLEGEPKIVLRNLVVKALKKMLKDDEYMAFMRVLIGESERFPEIAQFCVASLIKPTIKTLQDYLASHPELNISDPEATARIIVGSLVHFVMTQKMMHGADILPMETHRLTDTLTDLLLFSQKSDW